MYMLFHAEHPPNTKYVPTGYQLLEPVRLRVRRPDGRVDLMGYGIGEVLEVLEPELQYAVVCHRRREEIALADGSWIVDPPTSIDVRYFHA